MVLEKTYENIQSLSETIRNSSFEDVFVAIYLHGSHLDYFLAYNGMHHFTYQADGDELVLSLYRVLRDMSCELLTSIAQEYQTVNLRSVRVVNDASDLFREENNVSMSFSISLNISEGKVLFDCRCKQYSDIDNSVVDCYVYTFSYDSVPPKRLAETIANVLDSYCRDVDSRLSANGCRLAL